MKKNLLFLFFIPLLAFTVGLTTVKAQYSVATSCATFTDISGTGTSVGTISDDSEHNITLPFSFTFNDVAYTTASVGNNGVLMFGTIATPNVGWTNAALPTTLGTGSGTFSNAPALCPMWDDMTPGTGGSLKTQQIGSVFYIQWTNEDHPSATGTGTITFQIQLVQTSNIVRFVYPDVTYGPGAAQNNGGSATIGLQFTATTAQQYSFNTQTLSDGFSICYTPPGLCSGTPTPGNTTSSANPVCSGANFNLGMSGSLVGTDLTYQWQSGPTNAGPWTNLGTAVTQTTSQTSGTYYQCIVTCPTSMLSATSTPLLVNMFTGGGGTAVATPSSQTVQGCAQGSTSLSVTGFPVGSTFQWQSSANSGGPYTNIAGATNSTVDSTGIQSDVYFICQVTACGSTLSSNEVFFDLISTSWTVTSNQYIGDAVSIPDYGNANPYPSTINVSGLTGTVAKVVVQLCGATHTLSSDVDIALVSPSGEVFVMLADAGLNGAKWLNTTYLFDDAAATQYPNSSNAPSGSYRPMVPAGNAYSGVLAGTLNYAAPLGSSTFASVFNGILPNGNWSLYVYDDFFFDSGNFDSWTLGIDIYDPCLNNIAVVPPTNGTTYVADYACPDVNEPNFTNYFDNGGTPGNNTDDYLLLSIDNLTNPDIGSIDDGTFSVQVSGAAGASWITSPTAPYVEDPLFIVMNRWWNVSPNCGTCINAPNIDADANVRFYFTQQDFNDVVSSLIAGGANPGLIAQVPDDLFMYKINEFPGPYDANPANAHTDIPEAPAYDQDGYWEYVPGLVSSGTTWSKQPNAYTGSLWGAEFTVAAFSGGGGGGGQNGFGALPIELLYFTGHAEATANVIEWATATEKNNQYQIIERSATGNGNWTEIGRKTGAVNSTQTISYKMLDEAPLSNGYYRLRAIDFDGHEQLSDVIFIQRTSDILEIVNTYPVPVAKNLTLMVNAPASGKITVRLSDLSGKLLTEKTYAANRGMNSLELDMTNFAAGSYQVVVTDGVSSVVNNIIKQ